MYLLFKDYLLILYVAYREERDSGLIRTHHYAYLQDNHNNLYKIFTCILPTYYSRISKFFLEHVVNNVIIGPFKHVTTQFFTVIIIIIITICTEYLDK